MPVIVIVIVAFLEALLASLLVASMAETLLSATEMTVEEFTAYLKKRKSALFDASSDRNDSNIWRSSMLGRQAATKGGLPPIIARHTRASMQRK